MFLLLRSLIISIDELHIHNRKREKKPRIRKADARFMASRMRMPVRKTEVIVPGAIVVMYSTVTSQ